MTVKVSGSSGLIFLDGILQSYGDSNDLQINHDGSNSYINDAGTGNLRLQTGGITKLEVTSTGIDVTGTVTADGLTVDNGSISTVDITGTAAGGIRISGNGTTLGTSSFDLIQNSAGSILLARNNETLYLGTNNTKEKLAIAGNGDISFYEDTGTTPKFFWDASAESLGIGTTSPGTSSSIVFDSSLQNNIRFNNGGTFKGYIGVSGAANNIFGGSVADELALRSSSAIAFAAGNARSMTIDSSGNVGIGTSSPDFALDIEAPSSGVQLQIGRTVTSAGSAWMGADSNGFHLGVGTYTTGNTVTDPNGFTVDTSGNVGIGTTSPSAKLDVVGDIEVSGGVYVGGTGSANYLDDYEEGTWTPVIRISNSSTGVTFDVQQGSYTKIGRQVTCNAVLNFTSKGSNTGAVTLDNIPFAVADLLSSTAFEAVGLVGYAANMTSNFTVITVTVGTAGTTECNFYYQNAVDTSMNSLTGNDIANNTTLRFSFTYFTNS